MECIKRHDDMHKGTWCLASFLFHVLVVRVIDGDFNAKQYLIRLMLAAKSLNAGEVAHTHTPVHTGNSLPSSTR